MKQGSVQVAACLHFF